MKGPQMRSDSSNVVQARVLTLNDIGRHDSTLYRLQKGWLLQFRLGPSLFGRRVTIYTNHPVDENDVFDRAQYRKLEWQSDIGAAKSARCQDDTASYADLKIVAVGSFHYYFVFDDEIEPQGSGYVLVDPVLTYGKKDEVLPLDCIQCQTHLSKCLGKFDEWRHRLSVAKEAGYNMVHFTPVQELGASQSGYSLADQHKLNPSFNTKKSKYTLDDVAKLVKIMRDEWKVLSITDIVLNHTANESKWIQEHPESAYNLENSPHLRPAFLLDQIIWQFAMEIAQGKWESSGIPKAVDQEAHLQAIKDALNDYFLPLVKLHEFYTVDVDSLVAKFRKQASALKKPLSQAMIMPDELKIIQDPKYRRLQSTVDVEVALQHFNVPRYDCLIEEHRLDKCCLDFERKLKELNTSTRELIQTHLTAAVNNVVAGMLYERLQSDGPRIKEVSKKHPLVPRYFTHSGPDLSLEEEERLSYDISRSRHIMAQNGWVMGDDPLRNFAEADSNVYIRRELIAWNDSVKLRYGRSPDDSPYLWQHMREYVESTARIFHGIRLDNCHSTPIHVAEYLLDAARRIRPNLYVVAELFTQSESTDNVFVNRLGINSLIREAMSAGDSHEEGRLIYRYGGQQVGAFYHCQLRPLTSSVAHAVLFDLTHDNPSPIEKRSVYDLLPNAALVSMACCATGSNRGYDELIPHHIHVVKESRFYQSFSNKNASSGASTSLATGLMACKKAFNKLHFELGLSGFSEVYVDQVDEDIVAVTRHCPHTHESVVLVAFTAFQHPWNLNETRHIPPLRIEGQVEKVILEACLVHEGDDAKFVKNETHINGLVNYRAKLKENIQLSDSEMSELGNLSTKGDSFELNFKNFYPGSVVAFRISLSKFAQKSITVLRNYVSLMGYNVQLSPKKSAGADIATIRRLKEIISKLNLVDLNKILFKCEAEEQDDCPGRGVYHVPGFKPFLYAGLQGLMSVLSDIHLNNDLGHPLCENLRSGDWLAEYIVQRLRDDSSTKELADWFASVFEHLKCIPRYLNPTYFDVIISGVYSLLLSKSWNLMSSFVSDGSTFVRALALGSVALAGVVRSAPLPNLAIGISPPHPAKVILDSGATFERCTTLSAGLPHFSTGYMRNWGRDTFIALRGMFLVTGRFDEARYIILGFGGCLRHGLIPNLLDGGRNARFNCRDAVWWWLQSIQDYCTIVPNGHKLLKEPVRRLFPTDNASKEEDVIDQPLEVVIQEALQRHIQGVQFRERNAGSQLDREMTDEGFNNRIGVDEKTGFVYGGNVHNCGTWMDKMGSSEVAGNKGKPATPRDGSAVEIVGLSKSALRWLIEMNKKGRYSFNSITQLENGTKKTVSLAKWNEKIRANFEHHFWIGDESESTGVDRHPELINKRNIYKDCFGASQQWTDYQLRCNFPIAMVVAPELFDPSKAWKALSVVEECLLGPLGMKTLDSTDWAYEGNYDNSNDTSNSRIAKGFNYHQGPEWLWPVGYFLRAKLHFAKKVGGEALLNETILLVKRILSRHYEALQTSKWCGLPELTNKDGAYCSDSCRIQAWSHSCLLDVLYDMSRDLQ